MPRHIFHLLPNAHLDPVWLWDWREGLNEGITTVKTVLDLMDEFPELTFIRGEAAIYEHIQKQAPAVFDRIVARMAEGRWDVVGGTYIQPDTNLPATEVLCRQFERGLDYFQKNLGVTPTIAWQADSFGHSAGLPNIFSSFGIEGFAFTRPQRDQFALEYPAFWWKGDWENKVLCYRQHWPWYCSERGNIGEILSTTLRDAAKQNLTNVGVLLGLGNHGGGPSRRHLHDIRAWSLEHPDVEVRFSTLHDFFRVLKEEISSLTIPAVRGEFGFCLRGCYSSLQKFKALYHKAETLVAGAEMAETLIPRGPAAPASLTKAWDALLFNAFHDILPGSSIERAFDDQLEWMGGAIHEARGVQFDALNRLAAQIDSSVPPARGEDLPCDVPILLWNPRPQKFEGQVEIEASMDYRPLYAYQGRPGDLPVVAYDAGGHPLPLQKIATEHSIMPDTPWRARAVIQTSIPPWGWSLVRLGWRDEAPVPSGDCRATEGQRPSITNGEWKISVQDGSVSIARHGKNFFSRGRKMEFRVVEDPWGAWGGMAEEPDSFQLEKIVESWRLVNSAVTERGPLRAKLWTRWEGAHSWAELTFIVAEGCPHLRCEARMLWNERSRRLKLVLPCQGRVECEVPASRVERDVDGQVPVGRWITRSENGASLGFASDALSDMDATARELRITLARASRYADDVRTQPDERPWQPAVDCGELKCEIALFDGDTGPNETVEALLSRPSALTVPPSPGVLPAEGSLGNISSPHIKVLAIQPGDDGETKIRVQNISRKPQPLKIQLGKTRLDFGKLQPLQIRTVTCTGGKPPLPPAHERRNGADHFPEPSRSHRNGTNGKRQLATRL